MKSTYIFMTMMLLIIIVASTLSSYKIETFVQNSDNIPKTPNDVGAYNYLANVKKWDVNSLSKEQLFVLFTMRVLQSEQYVSNTREFPYLNGIVIPYFHLPIFNKDKNDRNGFNISIPNKTVFIKPTENKMHPEGVYIDLSHITFLDLKNILNVLYEQYDSEFIEEELNLKKRREIISREVKPLEDQLENLKRELQDMTKKAKEAKEKYDKEMSISQSLNEEMKKYRACG